MANTLPAIESLSSLLAEPIPEPSPIIDNFLERGSKLMIVGGSKSYKSWSLMDLGLCVALKEINEWLGMKVHHGRVLYINFELHRYYYKERIKAILKSYNLSATQAIDSMDVWNLRGHATGHDEMSPMIQASLKKGHYVLIIIDPIYKFYGSKTDENNAKDIGSMLNSIEQIASGMDVAIAYAHHLPKGDLKGRKAIDMGSGSGVFGREPDAIGVLRPTDDRFEFDLEFELRYHPPKDTLCVRVDFPRIRLAEDRLPQSENKRGPKSKYDQDDLKEAFNGKPLANVEWQKYAKDELGMSASTFKRLRDQMRDNESVTKLPGNFYLPNWVEAVVDPSVLSGS